MWTNPLPSTRRSFLSTTSAGVGFFAETIDAVLVAALRALRALFTHLFAGLERPKAAHVEGIDVLPRHPEGRVAGVCARLRILVDGGDQATIHSRG